MHRSIKKTPKVYEKYRTENREKENRRGDISAAAMEKDGSQD